MRLPHSGRICVQAALAIAFNLVMVATLADFQKAPQPATFEQVVEVYDVIGAGDHRTPRKDLQGLWVKLAAKPNHPYRDDAREMLKLYQSLLEEDRTWIEPNAEALANLTTEQLVAYWLYHLRDLAVWQWGSSELCREQDAKKPNAAAALVRLGMAAVPQLIAHLDDARPTRSRQSILTSTLSGPPTYLLRYGDCCQEIFETITGHTIHVRTTSFGFPIHDQKGQECKANAERWWRDYQKKGDKQMLIESTEAGGRDSVESARRLVAKYPDVALVTIIKSARVAKDAWVRGRLVLIADQFNGAGVMAFLHAELDSPSFDARINAAAALAARAEPAGVKSLLREWAQRASENSDYAARTLVRSGNAEVLRRLADDMPRQPVLLRQEIIRNLHPLELQSDPCGKPLSAEAEVAIADLLAKAIADPQVTSCYYMHANGKPVNRPSIGDLAANTLVGRWKQPELFDITGPHEVRERHRVQVLNVWLQKRVKAAEQTR